MYFDRGKAQTTCVRLIDFLYRFKLVGFLLFIPFSLFRRIKTRSCKGLHTLCFHLNDLLLGICCQIRSMVCCKRILMPLADLIGNVPFGFER